MLQIRLDKGRAHLVEQESPTPAPTESLVQLRVAALGPRELSQARRGETAAPGAEFVGRVLESGRSELVGQRVVARPTLPCGLCLSCLADDVQHCRMPRHPGSGDAPGALAELFCWPTDQLLPLPSDVRDYDAALAHGVAAGLAAREATGDQSRILVAGDSPRAAVVALLLRDRQRKVYFAPGEDGLDSPLKRFSIHRDPGSRFAAVVACCEEASAVAAAALRVAAGGTLFLHRVSTGPLPVDLAPLVAAGVRVVPVGDGPLSEALEWLSRRELCEALAKVRVQAIPFCNAAKAWQSALRPGSLQVILDNLP